MDFENIKEKAISFWNENRETIEGVGVLCIVAGIGAKIGRARGKAEALDSILSMMEEVAKQ